MISYETNFTIILLDVSAVGWFEKGVFNTIAQMYRAI